VLYVTTRNSKDAYTAHRALCERRGPDGGLYVPFRRPSFTPDEMGSLLQMPFNACVAALINKMFNTRLTSWDIDFAVGRNPVRLHAMSHRITVGECWHNPEGEISYLVRKIADRIRVKGYPETVGDWPEIGVRIAVLFGIFGQMHRSGAVRNGQRVDVAVVSGDFSAPMAAWYARSWGLPIGNIVCCCNENSFVWELFHHGELRTGAVASFTALPDADTVVPVSLERLLFGCGGYAETYKYVEVLRRGGVYRPNDVILSRIRSGMDISVVSGSRTKSAIMNVWRSHGYLMGPYTALSYTGLLDYRSRAGESGPALILAEKGPAKDMKAVAGAMGIPEEEMRQRIDLL